MGGDVADIEKEGTIPRRFGDEAEGVVGDLFGLVAFQRQRVAVEVIGVGIVVTSLPAGQAEAPGEAAGRVVGAS